MNEPVPPPTHCQVLIDIEAIFFHRLLWDYSHSQIIPPRLLQKFSFLWLSLTNDPGQPPHPWAPNIRLFLHYATSNITSSMLAALRNIPNRQTDTHTHTRFPLLGLLLEPKYSVLLQDKGSCALKRRAGSGRWYTHWQMLMDTETTPILRFPVNYSNFLTTLTLHFLTIEKYKVTLAMNVIWIFCHQGVVYQME